MNFNIKKNWRIGILGAGRVGSSIASALYGNKIQILSVVSRTSRSASVLAKKTNCKIFSNKIEDLRTCNVVIVSVPDKHLKNIAQRVMRVRFNHDTVLLIHTSGMYGVTVWNQQTKKDKKTVFLTAAMHPLQTFAKRMDTSPELFKTYFAIDGKPRSIRLVKQLVKLLGGNAILIPDEKRVIYHASAVMASNFLVALSHASTELLRIASLKSLELEKIILPIQRQTLSNIDKYGTLAALTGPAMRGDQQTIRHHKKLLKQYSMDVFKIYNALSSYCTALSKKRQRGKHG